MDYRITDYGAVADGTTNNRAAIQAAVDACTVAGGGRVIVPIGQFLSGTIVLKSNVTLYLERGAELISSLRNVVKICYFSMWNILEKNSGAVRASLGKEYGADCRRVVFRSAGVFGGVAIRKRRGEIQNAAGCICIRSSGSMSRNPWRCGSGKNAGSTVRTNCSFISVEGKLLCWSSPVDCAGRSSRGGSLSDDFSA